MPIPWIRRCALTAAALLAVSCAVAAPPALDVKPVFGDHLVQGVWQPVVVTLTNPTDGDSLHGEVEVAVVDSRTGRRLGACSRPLTLPRGAGIVTASLPVYVSPLGQPDLQVTVRRDRDGSGDTVTYRRFDKLPVLPERPTLVAVSGVPDTLRFLDNVRLGIWQSGGVLSSEDVNQSRYSRFARRSGTPFTPRESPPLQVVSVADPANLPTRAGTYEGVGIVYLGADVRPDLFSDSQIAALKQHILEGSLLVVGAGQLRTDERFRTWLPSIVSGTATPATVRWGRGMIVTLGFDPTAPSAATEATPAFWSRLALAASSPVAEPLNRYRSFYGSDLPFAAVVLRAPGLDPPGYGAVALFLGMYLFLLVPVNYLLLKKWDRREWSWVTIPGLVVLFSVGAYAFGRATKGSRVRVNVASIAQMEAGRGDASVRTAIGLFSPARARYALSVSVPDALLWSPSMGSSGFSGGGPTTEEGSPITASEEDRGKGITARGVDVPMWAMRVVGARTNSLRIGDGLGVNLRRRNGHVIGTIRNRTGHRLRNVLVFAEGVTKLLNELAPDQSVTVDLTIPASNQAFITNASQYVRTKNSAGTENSALVRVRDEISESLSRYLGNIAYITRGHSNDAYVEAWDDAPLVPVSVAGSAADTQIDVTAIVVHTSIK